MSSLSHCPPRRRNQMRNHTDRQHVHASVCVCSLSATFAVGNFPVARTKKVFQPQTGSSLSLSLFPSPGYVPE